MTPNVMRSLGAVAPSNPKALDGTIVGTANRELAAAAVLKKLRRDAIREDFDFGIMELCIGGRMFGNRWVDPSEYLAPIIITFTSLAWFPNSRQMRRLLHPYVVRYLRRDWEVDSC